jgi:hypothetical protein
MIHIFIKEYIIKNYALYQYLRKKFPKKKSPMLKYKQIENDIKKEKFWYELTRSGAIHLNESKL